MRLLRLEDVAEVAEFKTTTDAKPARRKSIPRILISECLRLYDFTTIVGTGLIIYVLYVLSDANDVDTRYPGTTVLGAIMAAALAQKLGAYQLEAVFSRMLGGKRAVMAWFISFGILLTAAFALKLTDFYSRIWAVSWLLSTTGVMLFGRYVLSLVTLRWAEQGRFAFRTLIVGIGEQAEELAAHLAARGDARTRIVGFVDDLNGPSARHSRGLHGHPVISGIDRMMALIRQNIVDEVIIALPWSQAQRVQDMMILLAMTPVRIRLAPDLAGFRFADRRITTRAGVPMLTLLDRPISGWSHAFKLIEDQVIASIALIFTAPLMVLIAIAIKLDSPGPVLFRQRRLGFNDQLIEVWKFRSMSRECAGEDTIVQATRSDPRVTRVGRLLRKSSLDELPQLFNVLKGDMSIIGPRPHAVTTMAEGRLFQEVVHRYAARHRVKPGITGWAQVNGWRGETDTIEKIRNRVEYDVYYIDNWSIWFDLCIILRTVVAIFRSGNVY